MSLSSTVSRVSFAGNSSTTVFSFPYYFLKNADLVVILKDNVTGVETLKTITTHYTVTGAAVTSGGSVTMLVAPATGETLTIYRDPSPIQEVDLVENDDFPAETIEKAFDLGAMEVQRLKDRLDRAMRLTDGYAATFDPTLPPLLTADSTLAINPTGDGFVLGATVTDISTATAASAASAAAAAASETAAAASAGAASTSATASASSATASAASAASAAAQVASAPYRDVIYVTSGASPITIAQSDNGKFYVLDTSGGAITVNLPSIAGLTLAFNIGFLVKDATNLVTINRNGTDTIMGATSKVLTSLKFGCQFIADVDATPDDWSVLDFFSSPMTTGGDLIYGGTSGKATRLANGNLGDRLESGGGTAAPVWRANGGQVVSKSANYTAALDDSIIKVDATSASFTITLPAASTATGKRYTIIRTDATIANSVTVDGNASELIETTTTKLMWGKHENLVIVCDGTGWYIESWINMRSEVFLKGDNTYGSTNTRIRRFATTITNRTGDITYADSATLGASFTINTTGRYTVWWYDRKSVTGNYQGVSLNSANLTTGILSIPDSEVLGYGFTPLGAGSTEWTGQLTAGDILRPHDNSDDNASTTPYFKIQRIG